MSEHDFTVIVPGARSRGKLVPSSDPIALPEFFLVFGTKLVGTAGPVATPTEVFTANAGHEQWGWGSTIGETVNIVKRINPAARVVVVAMDEDVAAVAASATITITGAATAAGPAIIPVNGKDIAVAVAVGDTAAEVVTALAAIDSTVPELNVAAAVGGAANELDLTCKWEGADGNDIGIGEITLPAGLATSTPPTALTGGAVDPDETTAFAAVDQRLYRYFITPWTQDATMDVFEAEVLSRTTQLEAKRGFLFSGTKGSQGTMLAYLATRNSFVGSVQCTGLSESAGWRHAAAVAAERSKQRDATVDVTGASLSRWVKTPRDADIPTALDRDQLMKAGGSTYLVANDGNAYIESVLTSYTTDLNGAPNNSYRYLTKGYTLYWVHENFEAALYQDAFRNKSLIAETGRLISPNQIKPSSIQNFVKGMVTSSLATAFADPVAMAETVLVAPVPGNQAFLHVTLGAGDIPLPYQGSFVTVSHT